MDTQNDGLQMADSGLEYEPFLVSIRSISVVTGSLNQVKMIVSPRKMKEHISKTVQVICDLENSRIRTWWTWWDPLGVLGGFVLIFNYICNILVG